MSRLNLLLTTWIYLINYRNRYLGLLLLDFLSLLNPWLVAEIIKSFLLVLLCRCSSQESEQVLFPYSLWRFTNTTICHFHGGQTWSLPCLASSQLDWWAYGHIKNVHLGLPNLWWRHQEIQNTRKMANYEKFTIHLPEQNRSYGTSNFKILQIGYPLLICFGQ